MTAPFHGAKIALVHGAELLAYRRDDRAGLLHPGLWDLPGGGREGDESPDACVLREIAEEFGLALPPHRIATRRRLPSIDHPGHFGWFMTGAIGADEIAAIRFGDEGQEWRMMPVAEFAARADAVPALRARVAAYVLGDMP